MNTSSQTPKLVPICLDDLETAIDEPPEFVIDRILPRGYVTLLSGHGGSGKSQIAMTMAMHVAADRDWCGLATAGGRVLFLSLEDGTSTLRYRLSRYELQGAYQRCWRQRITVLDGTRSDSALFRSHGSSDYTPTSLFTELDKLAQDHDLIVIDNASEAFYGEENARRQVAAFMRTLGGLAQRRHAAVLLISHIDKASANGSGNQSYSGSTAWHNSARSRLTATKTALNHEKSNLGPIADPIAITFEDGLIKLADSRPVDTAAQVDADALGVLKAALSLELREELLPAGKSGPDNVRQRVIAETGWQKDKGTTNRIDAAITLLLKREDLEPTEEKSSGNNTRTYYQLTDAGRTRLKEVDL